MHSIDITEKIRINPKLGVLSGDELLETIYKKKDGFKYSDINLLEKFEYKTKAYDIDCCGSMGSDWDYCPYCGCSIDRIICYSKGTLIELKTILKHYNVNIKEEKIEVKYKLYFNEKRIGDKQNANN